MSISDNSARFRLADDRAPDGEAAAPRGEAASSAGKAAGPDGAAAGRAGHDVGAKPFGDAAGAKRAGGRQQATGTAPTARPGGEAGADIGGETDVATASGSGGEAGSRTGSASRRARAPGAAARDDQPLAPRAGSGWNGTHCYCLALRQASRLVTQIYDHALAPVGLRGTQLPLLSALAAEGPLTMKALAALMVMDRATLGHNLRPLQAAGLVALQTGKDRRVRLVALTEAGRAKLTAARGPWRQAQVAFEAAFGAENAAALRGTLGQVVAAARAERAAEEAG